MGKTRFSVPHPGERRIDVAWGLLAHAVVVAFFRKGDDLKFTNGETLQSPTAIPTPFVF